MRPLPIALSLCAAVVGLTFLITPYRAPAVPVTHIFVKDQSRVSQVDPLVPRLVKTESFKRPIGTTARKPKKRRVHVARDRW